MVNFEIHFFPNFINLNFLLKLSGRAKRFEKPKLDSFTWTGIHNVTKWQDACPQPGIGQPPPGVPAFQTTTMSEDCLFLNVWTTNKPTETNKKTPVMVFIHGGKFLQFKI